MSNGYLDQLVVAPDQWGSELGNALVAEAKRLSPDRITLLVNADNARAIRFYARNGFVHAGEDVNPTSGRPVLRMEWTGNRKEEQRRSPMTRTELATGSATFIAVAAAGWLSATALDRHFARGGRQEHRIGRSKQ